MLLFHAGVDDRSWPIVYGEIYQKDVPYNWADVKGKYLLCATFSFKLHVCSCMWKGVHFNVQESQIDQLIPGAKLDVKSFDPYGFSVNAIIKVLQLVQCVHSSI